MRPLQEEDFDAAVTLLCEGFPHRGAAFWHGALARLQRYGGNAQAGHPLGLLLLDAGRPVGVALTPASLRHRADGSSHCVVNLSSWTARPAHRWRAVVMLRRLLADPRHTYTDLTATPELQRVLPKVGMRAVNEGIALHALPLTALRRGTGARVGELRPGDAWPDPAHAPPLWLGPPRAMVEAHRELGCLPLVVVAPDRDSGGGKGAAAAPRQALVIVLRTTVRGVPAAQLVYAEDRAWVLRHRGELARFLLARGMLLLVCETTRRGCSRGALFRPREVWFAKGPLPDGGTDIFGSELCIIHAPAARAARRDKA